MLQSFTRERYKSIEFIEPTISRIYHKILYYFKVNNAADTFSFYPYIKVKTMKNYMIFLNNYYRDYDEKDTLINNNGILVTAHILSGVTNLTIKRENLYHDRGTIEFKYNASDDSITCKYDLLSTTGISTKQSLYLANDDESVPMDEVTRKILSKIFRELAMFDVKRKANLYAKYNIY